MTNAIAQKLEGKTVDHLSLFNWARKTIARHKRGEKLGKDVLLQAQAVMRAFAS